ncbi:MAG: WecB/TagA/CpsF family glycosyltransferase [Acidobacteriota bacterium]
MSEPALVPPTGVQSARAVVQQSDAAPHGSKFLHPHASILGVQISALDLRGAVDLADRWLLSEAGRAYICATGVHGVMEAHADPALRQILNRALLNLPDGMPMTWVGRWQGHRGMDRVFGPDFMAEMCRISVERRYRHFFCGGEPGVAERLGEALQRRFSGLIVAGTWTPPFRSLHAAEEAELRALLSATRPHVLWVGMSTPKQERFMAQYRSRLPVPLLVGVGAAFDFHTGRIRDCSPWIKRCGLQWLHRLVQEPRRLWRRYLRSNPAFVWHVAWQLAGLRRSPRLPQPLPSVHRDLPLTSTRGSAMRKSKDS